MLHERRVRAVWSLGVLALMGWACEVTRNPGGIQRDLTPPSITLSNTAGDTQDISGGLRFTVNALDNLALRDIRLTYSGGYIAVEDTVFTGQVTAFSTGKTVTFGTNSGNGGNIRVIGRATDGAGNFSEDTLFVFLSNVNALQVVLQSPTSGAVASQNRYIPVQVWATQNSGVQRVGYLISPAGQVAAGDAADSIVAGTSPPYPDTLVFSDSVLVTGSTGSFTIVGFAVDSAGRLGTSNQISVSILSVQNDVTPPFVEHFVNQRAEVDDTITVHATDPSGILWIGYVVRNLAGTIIQADSVQLSGQLTDVTRGFPLNLEGIVTSYPTDVTVEGFAVDNAVARNRGVSTNSGTASVTAAAPVSASAFLALADTITIVAGITRPLPPGSRIMDAAVNANQNEIYLTNLSLDRLEVFSLAVDSFRPPITIPRPWGIALWPRDNAGNYGDTVIVANSGGTSLSIVDVNPAARRETRRHRLPNFLIQRISTTIDNGLVKIKIESYDFSDRPQYVAATRTPGGSVIALYSTTPTIDQDIFPLRGTLRWENLTSATPQSHFFFEHATAAADPDATDTLQIIVDRPWQPIGSRTDTVLCGATGVIVSFDQLPFGDTTFTRNSGDFTHAFFGEGGRATAAFARVLGYDAGPGLITRFDSADIDNNGTIDLSCRSEIDQGITPSIRVSDFISNTATRLTGIATNFNGLTNVVRTLDSIYVLDAGLRLAGTLQGTGGNPGMDLDPQHAFDPFVPGTPTYGGSGDPNDRFVFAARPDAAIDVFDTYFFDRPTPIGTIPIRDAVIGPLRIANVAGTPVLVGVTATGVVVVRLPSLTNSFPSTFLSGGN